MRSAVRQSLTLSMLILICGFTGACRNVSAARPNRQAPSEAGSLAGPVEAFGFRLLGEIRRHHQGENLCISPAGLAAALTMAANGAGGTTRQELEAVLGVAGRDLAAVNSAWAAILAGHEAVGPGTVVAMANSMWIRDGFTPKPAFIRTASESYGASCRSLDFRHPGAAGVINDWVRDHTRGRVPGIVDSISKGTQLMLLSAVHFSARWAVPFDPAQTRPRDFRLADGSTRPVPMMISESDRYGYLRGEGFHALKLAYGDGRLSLLLFVPDGHSGLDQFLDRLDSDSWRQWMTRFQPGEAGVLLPRFQATGSMGLDEALQAVGVVEAFGERADFRFVSDGKLFMRDVRHATRLEVTEEGTVAARGDFND